MKIKRIVIDASVALKWRLRDEEATEQADTFLDDFLEARLDLWNALTAKCPGEEIKFICGYLRLKLHSRLICLSSKKINTTSGDTPGFIIHILSLLTN